MSRTETFDSSNHRASFVDDVLYVSPNEATSMILVTEVLTGTKNYTTWKRSMEFALSARSKLGFVRGEIPKPSAEDSVRLAKWQKCNDVIMTWLISSVGKGIAASILHAKDAVSAWSILNKRYTCSHKARTFALRREICNLRQEDMPVANFMEKLVILWDELDALLAEDESYQINAKAKEEEHVMSFLMGLNEKHAQVRTQILAMREFPTLDEAYNLVAQDEMQLELTDSKKEGAEMSAFYSNNQVQSAGGSNRNKYPANTKADGNTNQQRNSNNKKNLTCSFCGFNGHVRENCFKLIGYPPNWRPKQQNNRNNGGNQAGRVSANYVSTNETSEKAGNGASDLAHQFSQEQIAQILALISQPKATKEQQHQMAGITCLNTSKIDKNVWVFDSGATEHFSPYLSLLKEVQPLKKVCEIILPDGAVTQARKKGNAYLHNNLILRDVLYVPGFKFNLLSVGKLIKDAGCSVIFSGAKCLIQDLVTQTSLGTGELLQGLYQIKACNEANPLSLAVQADEALHWHQKLGHTTVKKLIKCVPTLSYSSIKNLFCPVCPMARQTRQSFANSKIQSTRIFQLIHTDIWGPFPMESIEGFKYFLTIVDDYSRTTWIYMMKLKSEVPQLIKDFIHFVATQFGQKILCLRSDNGAEFFANDLKRFLLDQGCVHQSSCPYTPQQNGVAERKHRHVLEVARALRFQSNVPKNFWSYCVQMAVFIINRMPSQKLGGISPYEAFFGAAPDYGQLKMFGCLGYVYDHSHNRDKMDARACPCLFVGFPFGQKGYKMYDIAKGKVIISRHVVFHEARFPFKEDGFVSASPMLQHNFQAPNVEEKSTDPGRKYFLDPTATVLEQRVPQVPATVPELVELPAEPSPDNFSDETSIQLSPINSSEDLTEPQGIQPRRSTRNRDPPCWQKDYVCTVQKSPHSLSKVISYDVCAPDHKRYLLQISSTSEPTSYNAASKDPHWIQAMESELQALEDNHTWEFTSLPHGKKAIGSKWVYKLKYKSDGSIERYKARLVAKGYTQTYGLDFHETFAPVVKMNTVRLLLAVAACKTWPLFQLDVNNAFLHGFLEEEIYMQPPTGFYAAERRAGKVCKLLKSLYGLKQASRQWFARFSTALLDFGFKASQNDSSLFILHKDNDLILLLVYVDDVLLTGTSPSIIADLKQFLDSEFKIKDLGIAKYFLGIEVARSETGIFINQRKYALDVLQEFGFSQCKPCVTPMDTKHSLGTSTAESLPDAEPYRRLVGKLIYLTVTRPDLAYSVHILSQFISNPTLDHLQAAHRVLRYIKAAPAQGLFLSASSDLKLQAYCDADWASCPISRRSLTGYCVLLGSSLVSWKTKKQATVSRSSAESEYRSMAQACSEVLWLSRVLQDMGVPPCLPIPLFCDNKSAIHIAHNPVFHERTKHIEIDCHFIRTQVVAGFILPQHVSTTNQPADIFTKALSRELMKFFLSKLAVSNFLHEPACGGVMKQGMRGVSA